MEEFLQYAGASRLDLNDKNTLDLFLRQDPPHISELSFTNLFIWKERYQPCWKIVDDCLLVWEVYDGQLSMLTPIGIGDKEAVMELGMRLMDEAGHAPRMARADKNFVDRYVEQERYDIVGQPEQADYVYLRRELAELSGNRFHRKKNHLNKFLRTYPGYEYREISEPLLPAIKAFQQDWCAVRECTDGLLREHEAIMLALKHHQELDWMGAAILVDGQVAAYTLAEKLNPNTAVIHVEKANSQINGAYVAINQMFCQNSLQGYTYVNREQDLGLPGLRAAKESYHPHHMVNKYLVTAK